MAGIPFPEICPTSRSYDPGEFPRTLFESQNGAVTAIYFGFRPYNSKLQMTFNNISDDDAYLIVNHYKQCNRADGDGEWNYAEMPRNATHAMGGISNSQLQNVMAENSDNRRYRYAEPPVVTSVFPGRSSVSVKLVGILESVGARVD